MNRLATPLAALMTILSIAAFSMALDRPGGQGAVVQGADDEIQALSLRISEIDREVREAERGIRELEQRIKKIDQDIQADDAIIKKLEDIVSRAKSANNAQAEAVARENLVKPRQAKKRNEESRAALAAERKSLAAALESARAKESAWKGETRKLVAERHRRGMDSLTQSILESLDDPSKRLRPISKPFSDLQPGDVLLVAPEKEGNLVRLGDRLSSWEWGSQASHTFIYLKSLKGQRLFLDNMPGEGPLIKSEGQILKEYGALSMDVAQPLAKPDGDKMWEAAKKLVKANLDRKGQGVVDETGYGLYGDDNMVCSEASRWALIEAGVPVPDADSPFKRILGIYFGPSNFYSQKQHFLISAVEMPR